MSKENENQVRIEGWNDFAIKTVQALAELETNLKWLCDKNKATGQDVEKIKSMITEIKQQFALFKQETTIKLGWRSTIISAITTLVVIGIGAAIYYIRK